MKTARIAISLILHPILLFVGLAVILPSPLSVCDPVSFSNFLETAYGSYVAWLLLLMPAALVLSTLVLEVPRQRWVAAALFGESTACWMVLGSLRAVALWATFAVSLTMQVIILRRLFPARGGLTGISGTKT
jgi:hypothetical protein